MNRGSYTAALKAFSKATEVGFTLNNSASFSPLLVLGLQPVFPIVEMFMYHYFFVTVGFLCHVLLLPVSQVCYPCLWIMSKMFLYRAQGKTPMGRRRCLQICCLFLIRLASIKQTLGLYSEAVEEYQGILEKSVDYIPALKGWFFWWLWAVVVKLVAGSILVVCLNFHFHIF